MSKSHLHRLLICASLADEQTFIKLTHNGQEGADIKATIDCLLALGAKIVRVDEGYNVWPIDRAKLPDKCILPCAESGSTLRFMLPIASALGVSCEFHMSGRLPERPMKHLEDELQRKGIHLWRAVPDILCCEGQLCPGEFYLPGNISSQYVTGMLMALPLLNAYSVLHIAEPIESKGYIDMTLGVLEIFGQKFDKNQAIYEINGGCELKSPGTTLTEGDWSNAAFWLALGALPGGSVKVSGLNRDSAQGDRAICEILEKMGASVRWDGDVICVSHNQLHGIEIDASNIPDLIPVLSLVASLSAGETVIRNASRLRLKESDRLHAISAVLNTLGANIKEEAEGLRIEGVSYLTGATVDSYGDHRIAMMSGIASMVAKGDMIIRDSEAVNKSYPGFWQVLEGIRNG